MSQQQQQSHMVKPTKIDMLPSGIKTGMLGAKMGGMEKAGKTLIKPENKNYPKGMLKSLSAKLAKKKASKKSNPKTPSFEKVQRSVRSTMGY